MVSLISKAIKADSSVPISIGPFMQLYPGPSCYQSFSLVSSLSDANQEAHLYLPEVILCPNPRHLSFILNTWPTVAYYLELYTLGRLRAHPRCGYHATAIHSGRHPMGPADTSIHSVLTPQQRVWGKFCWSPILGNRTSKAGRPSSGSCSH